VFTKPYLAVVKKSITSEKLVARPIATVAVNQSPESRTFPLLRKCANLTEAKEGFGALTAEIYATAV